MKEKSSNVSSPLIFRPLSEVERRILNGKTVVWCQNNDAWYNCTVAGTLRKFQTFGAMIQWIEKQTGVNYPF